MTHTITLNVVGLPAPQGSKTRMPNGAMVEGSSTTGRTKHKAWRLAVTEAAMAWRDCHPDAELPLERPVWLGVTFELPMPASDPYRYHHDRKPDLSKLLRATEDALTDAGLIGDDAHIFAVDMEKLYTSGPTGALIRLGSAADVARHYREAAKAEARAARKAS